MTEHDFCSYPYASLTNAQLPLLKATRPYFDMLVILDPAGASWATIGAVYHARKAGSRGYGPWLGNLSPR